jgi:hypothetical protein
VHTGPHLAKVGEEATIAGGVGAAPHRLASTYSRTAADARSRGFSCGQRSARRQTWGGPQGLQWHNCLGCEVHSGHSGISGGDGCGDMRGWQSAGRMRKKGPGGGSQSEGRERIMEDERGSQCKGETGRGMKEGGRFQCESADSKPGLQCNKFPLHSCNSPSYRNYSSAIKAFGPHKPGVVPCRA